MAEEKTYEGGCHCGAVRYRVSLALDQAITCNCSICSKTGTMLSFTPATRFTLLSGDETLTDYQFGKKRLHHLFCNRCGIRSFARGTGRDGAPMVAVNVRCLDGVELEQVPTKQYDGRSKPID
jgi:hypothetical protein